jgi:hypothetical protein
VCDVNETYEFINQFPHCHPRLCSHPTAPRLIFRQIINLSPNIFIRQFLNDLNNINGDIRILMTEQIRK